MGRLLNDNELVNNMTNAFNRNGKFIYRGGREGILFFFNFKDVQSFLYYGEVEPRG